MEVYLLKIQLWQYSSFEYILVYAIDEDQARKKAAKIFFYNNGEQVQESDFKLATIF